MGKDRRGEGRKRRELRKMNSTVTIIIKEIEQKERKNETLVRELLKPMFEPIIIILIN